jgi:RNA polymerase sigma-70 factor (ECF subfamily)
MSLDDDEIDALLERASRGEEACWERLLEPHRERLRKMVMLRIDARVRGRLDASDIVQESFLEAWQRLGEYLRDRKTPFFLWLRFLTGQKLVTLHRRHLGARMRNADQEVSLQCGGAPAASSAMLAAHLLANDPRPSEVAVKDEIRRLLQEALEQMDPVDREVLVLRHFEQLSRNETARVLGLQDAAASKRYVRALAKLKKILAQMPGGLEGILG